MKEKEPMFCLIFAHNITKVAIEMTYHQERKLIKSARLCEPTVALEGGRHGHSAGKELISSHNTAPSGNVSMGTAQGGAHLHQATYFHETQEVPHFWEGKLNVGSWQQQHLFSCHKHRPSSRIMPSVETSTVMYYYDENDDDIDDYYRLSAWRGRERKRERVREKERVRERRRE